MAEVIVYIAQSVDGFIADRTGGIDFLKPYEGWDFGYDAFYRGVDAVVMGRKTYQHCRTFPEWPYHGRAVIVMTKGPPLDGDGLAVFDDRTPREIVTDLEYAGKRRIWLAGGGGPIRAFLDAGLVKRLILFQIPILLGAGATLWPAGRRERGLDPKRIATHMNGVVEMEFAVV
ncbi:dihydrofolate reductase family protein [Methyloraptor flagellatus]|uniref:Dihydrofolate reductase family protein n=1 Tax=Methyloraptor flagellatus TaxID=3162530 RepID=A0AAU7X8W7_9HYPH